MSVPEVSTKIIVPNNNFISIKKLVDLDLDFVYYNIKSYGHIIFDDGISVFLSHREIVLTRYLLEPIKTLGLIDEVSMGSKLNVQSMYINNFYTSKTFDNFVSRLTEIFVRTYIERLNLSSKLIEEFHRLCYVAVNRVYNEICYRNLDYVTDIDIRDFIELQDDPELTESLEHAVAEQSQDAVVDTYTVLDRIIRYDKYKHNPIAEGYITGTMNPNQLKQMLGARGFVTEINNHIFKIPVTSSYVKGLDNIYEFAIDSRSGAKALYLTVVAVEKAEYLARELQLVTSIVESIIDTDCGSKDYLDWHIRKPEENNGASDIQKLIGKFYLNENTGKLQAITSGDKHLEGTTIKLRNVMGCKLSNPRHICKKCFGEMSYNLFSHNNAGYISTTYSSHKVTQNLISTKHLTQSAKAESLNLIPTVSKYFITRANQYFFRANVNFSKESHKLIIEQAELYGLKELSTGSLDPDKINPARISRLRVAMLEVNTRNNNDMVEIQLQNKSTFGVLTKEAIQYIINNGYELDNYDRVVVDLVNWNTRDPMFYTPEVEFSYLDLAFEIKSMFKAMKDDETPESLLQKFFDAVNTRLSINLSLLEVVVYGFTVYDYDNGDFRLARMAPKPSVRKLENIITNRSLGVSYGWERLLSIIFNPKVYYGKNNIGTPMDLIIKPNEVVKRYLKNKE